MPYPLDTILRSYLSPPSTPTRQASEHGCFSLGQSVTFAGVEPMKLAAGSQMTEDIGLAVALGHGVVAAMSAIHLIFFVLLYFNM